MPVLFHSLCFKRWEHSQRWVCSCPKLFVRLHTAVYVHTCATNVGTNAANAATTLSSQPNLLSLVKPLAKSPLNVVVITNDLFCVCYSHLVHICEFYFHFVFEESFFLVHSRVFFFHVAHLHLQIFCPIIILIDSNHYYWNIYPFNRSKWKKNRIRLRTYMYKYLIMIKDWLHNQYVFYILFVYSSLLSFMQNIANWIAESWNFFFARKLQQKKKQLVKHISVKIET